MRIHPHLLVALAAFAAAPAFAVTNSASLTLAFDPPHSPPAVVIRRPADYLCATVTIRSTAKDTDRQAVAVAGRVREETISVDAPDISPEALGSWMRGRRGAIQSCYERELKRNHSLSGRLVLKFTISSRGRVTGLDLTEGSLQNPAVSDCITSLAKNWVLPFTPEDEVPVAFPFVFSPVN